jgi:hypothetical protein
VRRSAFWRLAKGEIDPFQTFGGSNQASRFAASAKCGTVTSGPTAHFPDGRPSMELAMISSRVSIATSLVDLNLIQYPVIFAFPSLLP